MAHYVYILFSDSHGVYYKGYTSSPLLRLDEHNQDRSRYTSGKGPWRMVYLERMADKSTALKREKQLKHANTQYIQWLISSERNIVDEFFDR